ncbi:T9SS type A sorting domain-containing protein [Calditrichota bacterium]
MRRVDRSKAVTATSDITVSHPDLRRDDEEIIAYEDEDDYALLWTLPSAYDDEYLFTRFTAEETPFVLVGIEVVIDDLDGAAGEPGMLVQVCESDDGYPGEVIAEYEIPSDSLILSEIDDPQWNRINFADYDNLLILEDDEDFHIVLSVIQGDEGDTLTLYTDEGENETDRSGIWSGWGWENYWILFQDLEGFRLGVNLSMRAVVDYEVGEPPDVDAFPTDVEFGYCWPLDRLVEEIEVVNNGEDAVKISFEVDDEQGYFEDGFFAIDIARWGENTHWAELEGDEEREYFRVAVSEALINEEPLQLGDEIGALTSDGLCAGWNVVDEDYDEDELFFIICWGDDEDTEEVDGFVEDEEITLVIWDVSAKAEIDPELENEIGFGDMIFDNGGFVIVSAQGESEELEAWILEQDETLQLSAIFNPNEAQRYYAEWMLRAEFEEGDAETLLIDMTLEGHAREVPDGPRGFVDDEAHIDEDSDWTVLIEDLDDFWYAGVWEQDFLYGFLQPDSEVVGQSVDNNLIYSVKPVLENWNGSIELTIYAEEEEEGLADYAYTLYVDPVNDEPEPFDLRYPLHGSRLDYGEYEVDFSWRKAEDVDLDTLSYTLYLSIEWEAVDTIVTYSEISDTSYHVSIDTLMYDLGVFNPWGDDRPTPVSWWVEAADGEYTTRSEQVKVLHVMVPQAVNGFDQLLPTEFAITSISPNPFNSFTALQYALDKQRVVSLALFDMNGREIHHADLGNRMPGYHAHTIQAEALPSGLYILRLTSGNEVKLAKVALMR